MLNYTLMRFIVNLHTYESKCIPAIGMASWCGDLVDIYEREYILVQLYSHNYEQSYK
jgi:hypothetical protein